MEMTLQEYTAMRQSGKTPEQIASGSSGKPPNGRLGGLVGGAARFLGVEEFGRGIATVGARGAAQSVTEGQMGVTQAQDKVLARIKQKREKGEDVSRLVRSLSKTQTGDLAKEITDIGTDNLTDKQVLGSAALTGLNIVSAGLPVGKTLGAKTAIGAATGGAFSGANAFKDDKAVLPAIAAGIALGGATAFVFGVAQKAISNALNKGPKNIMSKVVRQKGTDLAAEARGQRPELAAQMVEKGIRGSDEKIINDGTTKLINLEKQIDATLKRNKNTNIDTVGLVRSLDDLVERKRNVFGQKGVEAINEFKKNILAKGDKISVVDANQLKRDIYKELSDAAFARETLPQGKEILRTVAKELRRTIRKAVPAVAKLDDDSQFYIRMLDNIEARMRGTQKLNELGLSDTIFAATAIGSGEPTALAAGLMKRGLERTTARTNIATGLNRLSKLVQNLPTDSAGRVSKAALMNLIGKIAPTIGGGI